MKKISAIFDGLKFCEATQKYALDIAVESDVLLSGVFLDDFTYHSYKLFDMVGSQGVSKVKVKHLMDADREKRSEAAQHFIKSCEAAGERCTIHHDKSIASQELLRESIYSDLFLISKEETFSHFDEQIPTNFISNLLVDSQCPVIVVPSEYRRIEKVILLYDGKPASVYAIKMFDYMLPYLKDTDTEIVSVMDPHDSMELPDNDSIKEFVRCHYPQATYSILYGKAENEIVQFIKHAKQNILVVLGGYNRGVISRWFKESMADVLMREVSVPLFIAHR